jgi:hypothetical protein
LFKVVFVENGTAIHKISGNNPVKICVELLKFAKKKYGGVRRV